VRFQTSRGARQATWVLVVLSLAVFMSSLDLFIVNLAFPYIGREYPGTGLGTLSWVLNGYTIVFAAVLVPAGRWADRVGRRLVFVAGLVAFSLGSLLCGLAPGVAELIVARVIQAVGAGLMVPASLSLLLASVPATIRGQAIGTWSAFAALGAALGPVIGGSLVEISWRWVFWINLPVGLAAVLLATRVVPESRDERAQGRPDLIGPGPGRGTRLGMGLGQLHRPAAGLAGLRCGHGGQVTAASLTGHRARAAPLEDVQRSVRRLDPLLRRLRGLRAQHGRVPHRRVALHRGAGRSGHCARTPHGLPLRQVCRSAPGRSPQWPWPGGGDWLRSQRRRPAVLADPDPGPAGLPDAPSCPPADRRRRRRPDDPLAHRRRQRLAQPRALRHRQRNPQHGPPDRHRARRRRAPSSPPPVC